MSDGYGAQARRPAGRGPRDGYGETATANGIAGWKAHPTDGYGSGLADLGSEHVGGGGEGGV